MPEKLINTGFMALMDGTTLIILSILLQQKEVYDTRELAEYLLTKLNGDVSIQKS